MGLLLTILLSLLIVRFIRVEQSRKEQRVSLNNEYEHIME